MRDMSTRYQPSTDGTPVSTTAEPWLDVPAASKYLACKPRRIYELVAEGRLRHARDGRRLLFRSAWLDASLTESADA
jgi:excisionase family DNA binding protein